MVTELSGRFGVGSQILFFLKIVFSALSGAAFTLFDFEGLGADVVEGLYSAFPCKYVEVEHLTKGVVVGYV